MRKKTAHSRDTEHLLIWPTLWRKAPHDAIADTLHVPRLRLHVPFPALYTAGRTVEIAWQRMGRRTSALPPLTTYDIILISGDQWFSIEKARRELRYEPQYTIYRGIVDGVQWYREAKKGQLAERELATM